MRALRSVFFAFLLAGCATSPPDAAPLPWRDDLFAGGAAPRTGKDDLFRLDAELARELGAPELQQLRAKQRLDRLLSLVYGPDRRRFDYAAGHSTVAAETWRLRRGDCISLTVLTFAAARALGLAAVMQEVQVPAVYDRRGTLDYVNHHVNVLVRLSTDRPLQSVPPPDDLIIDFEPEFASTARGLPLSDEAVLARFHNNLGVEALARRDYADAYELFKAAARADRDYAPTYANLAVLYHERGLIAEAEQWLRHSVAISVRPEHPLRALHRLLEEQGRSAEAAAVAERLKRYQDNDPYYWVSEGIHHLNDNRVADAVKALEHAQEMTTGFTEVHRYLALAYWRQGEKARAQEQLALLAELNSGDPIGAKLRRKFGTQLKP